MCLFVFEYFVLRAYYVHMLAEKRSRVSVCVCFLVYIYVCARVCVTYVLCIC